MPVHAHHGAERLEPKRVGKPAQQLVAAIFMDDRLADHGAQARHALAKPFRHAAAVKRQIGAAGALGHQTQAAAWMGVVRGTLDMPRTIAAKERKENPAALS